MEVGRWVSPCRFALRKGPDLAFLPVERGPLSAVAIVETVPMGFALSVVRRFVLASGGFRPVGALEQAGLPDIRPQGAAWITPTLDERCDGTSSSGVVAVSR